MKWNIAVLITANNDLLEICDNLSVFDENLPNLFNESFYKFIDNVSNMPYMYPQYARNPKYRKAALAYNYLAFYQIDKKNNIIKIYRILHGRRNINDLI